MTIIRTDMKRRIVRFSAGAAVFAAFSAAVASAFTVFPGALADAVPAEKEEQRIDWFPENDIVNSSDLVLYTAEKPAVTQTAPDRPENDDVTKISISGEKNPDKYLMTVNRDGVTDDLSVFSEHSGRISEETFGKAKGAQIIDLDGGGQLRNCTDLTNSEVISECSRKSGISVELYSSEPQVLIVHTHTSESYEPYEKDWYDKRYTSRSADTGNSVVAVGDAVSRELAASGISVIHDCTVHDAVYNGAYSRSLATTESVLERYPSVKIVLDIHRDAIEYEDGTRVSAVTGIDGVKAAQIMIICAADDGSYDNPHYLDNLRFACELQRQTETMFPTLTRPVLFQYCQYNQQVSGGALLIEVGSHGNSTAQAVKSGELIGKALSAQLKKSAVIPINAVPLTTEMPLYFLDRLM